MTTAPHDDIAAGVAELLAQVIEVSPASIAPSDRLAEDLGVDSLSLLELMIGVEERFGVAVPDAAVAALQRVEDVVAYVSGAVV